VWLVLLALLFGQVMSEDERALWVLWPAGLAWLELKTRSRIAEADKT
jgi:hypothetical protein